MAMWVAIVAAVVVTLLAGSPAKLPDVALDSDILFHFERALALVIGLLIVLVVLTQTAKGNLPVEISKDGMKFGEALQAVEDVKEAKDQVLDSEPDLPGERAAPESNKATAKSVMELRMTLEAQMAYVAKWLLRDGPDRVSYATIGSLRYDGFLTEAEANTAARVLALRDEELGELSPKERKEFLDDADRVVSNLRAGVFYGLVRELLQRNGFEVKELKTEASRRPHLLAEKDGAHYLIVPRFVMKRGESTIFNTAHSNLQRLMKATPDEVRVIVVPDRSKRQTDTDGDPAVMKLADLKERLSLSKDPRSLR